MVFHSLVIPVFNENEGIDTLHKRVSEVIEKSGEQFEVILVNDGSRDGSDKKLDALSKRDPRFKVVHLSRNFGHQIAITAGIEWASGKFQGRCRIYFQAA